MCILTIDISYADWLVFNMNLSSIPSMFYVMYKPCQWEKCRLLGRRYRLSCTCEWCSSLIKGIYFPSKMASDVFVSSCTTKGCPFLAYNIKYLSLPYFSGVAWSLVICVFYVIVCPAVLLFWPLLCLSYGSYGFRLHNWYLSVNGFVYLLLYKVHMLFQIDLFYLCSSIGTLQHIFILQCDEPLVSYIYSCISIFTMFCLP